LLVITIGVSAGRTTRFPPGADGGR
jgi:hypothetical protein